MPGLPMFSFKNRLLLKKKKMPQPRAALPSQLLVSHSSTQNLKATRMTHPLFSATKQIKKGKKIRTKETTQGREDSHENETDSETKVALANPEYLLHKYERMKATGKSILVSNGYS